jgi:hypothetical protein
MNKTQLIEAVNKLPDDVQGILVAKDSEGNEFHLLDEFSIHYVDELELENGDIESILSEEDILEDSEATKVPDSFKKVAVIWPY